MPIAVPGSIKVTTSTGSSEITCADLRTWVLGGDRGPVVVPDATTYTLDPLNSGRVHVVPDVSASITITTPVPAAGLKYTFWYGGAAADAHDWVITTGSDTNYFVGGVVHQDQDADTDAPVYSDGNSNSKLTVIKPEVGTHIEIICDGTLWYLNGNSFSATVPTLGDQ